MANRKFLCLLARLSCILIESKNIRSVVSISAKNDMDFISRLLEFEAVDYYLIEIRRTN